MSSFGHPHLAIAEIATALTLMMKAIVLKRPIIVATLSDKSDAQVSRDRRQFARIRVTISGAVGRPIWVIFGLERERKRSSATVISREPNESAVRCHHLARQCQADTRTVFLGGKERHEDLRGQLVGNARPVIGNLDNYVAAAIEVRVHVDPGIIDILCGVPGITQ